MAQISLIEEVSLDGFQIVSSDMFIQPPRKNESTCSIWPTQLSFSKMAISSLNNCEYVRIEVHPKTKNLVVIPVTSSDKNGIRWINGKKELFARSMKSKRFGELIYNTWGLDLDYNYRAVGRLVTVNKKVMMLFDFNDAELRKTNKGGE